MPDDETDSFEIGLAMAGAISAGAYSAGVFDFLVQALDEWERHRGPGVPSHKVRLKVITGASAGAVTGALGAVALAEQADPVPMPAGNTGGRPNPQPWLCTLPKLYTAWVERPRMMADPGEAGAQDFLSDHDLRLDTAGHEPVVASVLNSRVLDDILTEALTPKSGPRAPRPWVARDLHIYMTVSNLRGVPYRLEMVGGNHAMMTHGDRVHYVVQGLGGWDGVSPWAWDDPGIQLKAADLFGGATPKAWTDYGMSALASSAFPVGLAARPVAASPQHYEDRKVPMDHPGSRLPKPDFPASLIGPPLRNFRFLNVDGGLINNEPLEYARFTLMKDPPHPNEREKERATRAVIMVDPFPEPPTFLGDDRPPPDLASVIAALLPALKNQARFKPAELLLAAQPDVRSRFMIAPDRRDVVSRAEQRFGIACGLLGGFGGFLDKKFREHDYQLGRANCQSFLRARLMLPPNHPLICSWGEGVADRPEFRHLDPQTREVEHPIIPLLGSAAERVVLPDWPRMPASEVVRLRERLDPRFEAVASILVRGQTTSRFLRFLVGIVLGRFKGRILDYARDAVLSDLIRRDQIEGWELPASLTQIGSWDDARAVLAELAKPSYDFRTVQGIAAATSLDEGFVQRVVNHGLQNPSEPYGVWRSDHLSKKGLPLYTLVSRRPSWLDRQVVFRDFSRWMSRPSED